MTHERHIGFLCFDGVVALDITGPAEAFSTACQLATQVQRPHYKISLVGVYPGGDAVGAGGRQRQYLEPPSFQTRSTDPSSELVAWSCAHLNRIRAVSALKAYRADAAQRRAEASPE